MLPAPPAEAFLYEDEKLYVCLASFPLTKGHVVVVWKDDVSDLHMLGEEDYLYLMRAVDVTRDALLDALNVEKVYLMYLDEIKHVHWHLVPRYDEEGVNILAHKPKEIHDFSIAAKIKESLDASRIM